MPKLLENTDHALTLDYAIKALSLEGMTFGDTTDIFRHVLPTMVQTFKHSASLLQTHFLNIFSSQKKVLINNLEHLHYSDIASILVITPEGFKGNFLSYIETLANLQPQLYSSASEVLHEYLLIVSAFLTNKEDQIAAKDQTLFFKEINASTEKIKAELASYFQAPNQFARARFSQVVSRIAELPKLITATTQLEKQHNQVNLQGLEVDLKKITTMLDILITRLHNKDISVISPASARNLAEGAQQVASYIEIVSLFHYKTTVIIKIIDELVKQLNKHI